MPMTYQTSSTSNMLSFKVVLISATSLLSAAIVLTNTDFAVYVPSIYTGLVSWLRPPYLYVVINCIIITIVASSKLQSRKDDPWPSSLDITQPPPPPQQQPVERDYSTSIIYYKYNGSLLKDSKSEDLANAADFAEDAMSNKENQYGVSNMESNNDLREYSPSNVKPPVSVRFSHRRNVKASPEGGRTVLGVSKPKRQDTLESTWKTITEGRPIPISRHLRKSDTWERDNHVHGGVRHPEKTMKKAETFNDRSTNIVTGSPSPGSGLGKVRKEPSLSQDELNRRVEAFIKKFNEEMRLQRQESLNQYMEMINRGSH